ncbi:MAG: hypothetical protein NT018_06875 [Armatimonadetes bacterium]|nr:hypothetical protein [Armatimonadota bacterium]
MGWQSGFADGSFAQAKAAWYASKMATKVVPILSVGEKGYIGGAQVSGPAAQVEMVDAVFQYEQNFSNNNYRAKVLLPSASLNPLKLERVPKVGVTAIIDYSLDGSLRYKTVGTGIQAGNVIRGAAVLIAVKNFGSSINNTLNTLTFNKGFDTKVLPMASVGEKMYLGGGQISASMFKQRENVPLTAKGFCPLWLYWVYRFCC